MTDIQRPNYFTAQFLVEEDFNDEQAYHRDMRLRHNRLLHEWGVVAGLEVTKVGDKRIAVSEGMAIDKDGREIIVLPDSPVPKTINLDGLPLNTTIEITIIYQEIQENPYRLGNETKYTRITERPKFVIYGGKQREHCDDDKVEVRTGSAPTDDNVIRLARVTLDNNGNVSTVDNSVRKLASAKLSTLDKLEVDGTISATNLNLTGDSTIDGSLTVNGNLEVKGDVIARDTEHIAGDVSLGDQDTDEVKVTGVIRSGHSSGALRVDDALHTTGPLTVNGNVGIGTTNPRQKLEVNGTVKATRFEGDGSALTGISAGKWSDGTSNRIYYNAGHVGIGTNNPSEKLEVDGAVKAKYLSVAQSGGRYSDMASFISKNPEPPYVNWYHNKSGGDTVRYGYIQAGDFGQHKEFRFRVENQANFTFLNGNVGIGTTNPQSLLQVGVGGVNAPRPWMTRGLQVAWDTDHVFLGLKDQGADRKDSVLAWGDNINDAFRFIFAASRGAADGQEIMRLQPNGNVGIGTTNPSQKLEVNGTVKATRFEGDGSALTGISPGKWSDGTSNRIYYNAGHVGIGINNPSEKLEVAGTVKAIATHTGRDSAYGVYSQAQGSDSGNKYGLYAQATGGSSGRRYGVYGGLRYKDLLF
ncbi:MAG: hypothetical protein F6K10_43950, partial [Moorea sp. SIO2B7]|nr:hypothetical protein [Moorena sp. SIO2B7]